MSKGDALSNAPAPSGEVAASRSTSKAIGIAIIVRSLLFIGSVVALFLFALEMITAVVGGPDPNAGDSPRQMLQSFFNEVLLLVAGGFAFLGGLIMHVYVDALQNRGAVFSADPEKPKSIKGTDKSGAQATA